MISFSAWRRVSIFLFATLALNWASSGAANQAGNIVPLSSFPLERIAVETRSAHRHLFEAWRAESPPARAQGLMFVEDRPMRPDQAMIFVYDPPERVAMWMKNTLLPLDMLFVDKHGCIVKVHEQARPGSLATISSGAPIMLVVELKGGIAAERGIRRGDRVVRLDKAWPVTAASCEKPAVATAR